VTLPFDGESNESYATDYSGNGHHGTVVAAEWSSTSGHDGFGAFTWKEANAHIDLGDVEMADFREMTVSAWFKTSDAQKNQRIVSKQKSGSPGDFMLLYNSTSTGWAFTAYDSNASAWQSAANSTAAYNDGNWHHIAGAVSRADQKIYLYMDGQKIAEDDFTAANLDDFGNDSLMIGSDSNASSPADVFNGTIDDLTIYNVSLSQEQIRALRADKTNMTVSQELSDGDIWQCQVIPMDGYESGIPKSSNTVQIIPVTYITADNVGANTTSPIAWSAVELHANWSTNATNLDWAMLATNETGAWQNKTAYGSPYDINLTAGQTWSNFTWQNNSVEGGTVVGWRIYANNSYGRPNVTDVMTFTVQSFVSITLTTAAVDFGPMLANESNSTSGGAPPPFRIRNDGNVRVNITVNGTDLWSQAANPTADYRFAANTTTEGVTYNTTCSLTGWTNMPAPNVPTLFLCFLRWLDSADEAETEIAVTVPDDEPPGAKSGVVTFIASQA
jgi:hypothetical protein